MNKSLFAVITEDDLKLPYYLTSAGGWNHQEAMVRERGFPDFQWIQCVSGEGVLSVEGRRMAVAAGQGMLLYPDTAHEYRAVASPWKVNWISFNGNQVLDTLRRFGFLHSHALSISDPDLTLNRLRQALHVMESGHAVRSVEGSALVYRLLLDLYQYGSMTEIRSRRQHHEQLSPALQWIEDNYPRDISLRDLADRIRVSPQYLCLLFQKALGIRPFEYLARFRIRKAKELLLQEPDLEINEISRRVGFEHPSYFIKVFKRHETVTPKTFRRIHRI